MNEITQKKTVAFDVVGTLEGPYGPVLMEMMRCFGALGWTTVVWSSNSVGVTHLFCESHNLKPNRILEKGSFIPEIAFDDDPAFLEVLEMQGCKGMRV